LAVKVNGNRGAHQKTMFPQKIRRKLYQFSRNFQFRSVT